MKKNKKMALSQKVIFERRKRRSKKFRTRLSQNLKYPEIGIFVLTRLICIITPKTQKIEQ